MKLSFKGWAVFILIAAVCFGLWYKFGYPRYNFIDLSVDKKKALEIAEGYLRSRGVDIKDYKKAVVFSDDDWADRYLQKTLGSESEENFLKQHRYDLFYWYIRFFKELKKEEFRVTVSSSSGIVSGFNHLIEDVEPREDPGKEAARVKAEEFLKSNYGFDPREYDFHKEEQRRFDARVDYDFSWEKKGVYVPWGRGEGGAKLLTSATVSGEEIREFHVNRLDIPEKFKRYIESQLVFGEYLASFSLLLFAAFMVWSVFIVIKKRHTLAVRLCKKSFFYLAGLLLAMNLAFLLNNMQNIIVDYTTTVPLFSYLWLFFLQAGISIALMSVTFIFPGLAGESLRSEELPEAKYSSFQHYVRSTFFSRVVSRSVALGYVLFLIMLGLQSLLFYLGQRYFGVWKEWSNLTQFSSAYIPFLGILIIGSLASLNEEIIFRVFAISGLKKLVKNLPAAVILSALIWGFAHTGYAIFPVWFRGIEVSCLGLLFGFVFVKYGVVPLLVAHYLFNSFLSGSPYILGRSTPALFASACAALVLPFAFAVIAYVANKPDEEKKIKLLLDADQRYNLEVLIVYLRQKKSRGAPRDILKKELINHNWREELVDLAIEEVFRGNV